MWLPMKMAFYVVWLFARLGANANISKDCLFYIWIIIQGDFIVQIAKNYYIVDFNFLINKFKFWMIIYTFYVWKSFFQKRINFQMIWRFCTRWRYDILQHILYDINILFNLSGLTLNELPASIADQICC